ncbi:hypothetical protein HY798_02010 [Candidatus Falkowbacteria bacterium]|nr:hypothetical protein [Candidatus Falkowbacteria bacterium]
MKKPSQSKKEMRKLRVKLAAALFLLAVAAISAAFLPADFLKQGVLAALTGNYNKVNGDSLTVTDWNNLDNDFINVGTSGQNQTMLGGLGIGEGFTVGGNSSFTGNVGIGTASPGEKLDVNGAGKFKQGYFSAVSGIPYVWLGYNDGTRDYGVYQWQAAGTAPVNYFQNNVGIGTANPGAKLEVTGDIKLSGVSPTYKITNLISPTASTDAATKGYVDAAAGGGATWMGYTASAYNGNMGGTKGINNYCNSNYSGSHACTWDEIIRLGNSYPWSYEAWVVDGTRDVEFVNSGVGDGVAFGKDGRVIRDGAGTDARTSTNCFGWSNSESGRNGPIVLTSGYMSAGDCFSTYRAPCCK